MNQFDEDQAKYDFEIKKLDKKIFDLHNMLRESDSDSFENGSQEIIEDVESSRK